MGSRSAAAWPSTLRATSRRRHIGSGIADTAEACPPGRGARVDHFLVELRLSRAELGGGAAPRGDQVVDRAGSPAAARKLRVTAGAHEQHGARATSTTNSPMSRRRGRAARAARRFVQVVAKVLAMVQPAGSRRHRDADEITVGTTVRRCERMSSMRGSRLYGRLASGEGRR